MTSSTASSSSSTAHAKPSPSAHGARSGSRRHRQRQQHTAFRCREPDLVQSARADEQELAKQLKDKAKQKVRAEKEAASKRYAAMQIQCAYRQKQAMRLVEDKRRPPTVQEVLAKRMEAFTAERAASRKPGYHLRMLPGNDELSQVAALMSDLVFFHTVFAALKGP